MPEPGVGTTSEQHSSSLLPQGAPHGNTRPSFTPTVISLRGSIYSRATSDLFPNPPHERQTRRQGRSPAGADEWEVRFGNTTAAKGWESLCQQAATAADHRLTGERWSAWSRSAH